MPMAIAIWLKHKLVGLTVTFTVSETARARALWMGRAAALLAFAAAPCHRVPNESPIQRWWTS